jgi:hypothetical protein
MRIASGKASRRLGAAAKMLLARRKGPKTCKDKAMLRSAFFALALSFVALPLAGCGGADSDSTGGGGGTPVKLAPADTRDFTYADALITAKVAINEHEGRFIVDSGSPVVLLNTNSFTEVNGLETASKVVVNDGSTFSNVQVLAEGNLTSPDPKVPIDGLLGCEVICQTKAFFDYRAGTLSLGSASTVTGVGPLRKVPFSFEGGETVDGLKVPKSRVVVSVMIEGEAHSLIVDTGASSVTIRSTVFNDLIADGRPTLVGPTLETTSGTSKSTVARASSIAIGSVEAKDVIMVGDPAFDKFLDSVAKEVGHPIDGSSFIVDIGHSVGFELGTEGTSFLVASVVPGTDAETKGVVRGDQVEEIDGKVLSNITLSEVSELVSGAIGKSHAVKFGSAASPTISNQTLRFAVIDLLSSK